MTTSYSNLVSIVDPQRNLSSHSQLVSIRTTSNAEKFRLFIERQKLNHFSQYERHVTCYSIEAKMTDTALEVHSIVPMQQPETSDTLAFASQEVSKEHAEQIIADIDNVEGIFVSDPNCKHVSFRLLDLQSSPSTLSSKWDDTTARYIANRNDQYLSFKQRLRALCEQMSFLFFCYRVIEPTSTPEIQIQQMFYPLNDLWQEIQNTIIGYRSSEERNDDMLRPIYGVMNILLGVGGFLWGTIQFFPMLLYACISFKAESFKQLAYPVSSVCEGTSNIAYGILQIITSPFLFITVPVRSYLDKPLALEDKEQTDKTNRINATAAMLKKMKQTIEEHKAGNNEFKETEIKEIQDDCQTVSRLLAEIELGSEKYKYQRRLFHENKDVVSPFFAKVKDHQPEPRMLAQEVMRSELQSIPKDPSETNRISRMLHTFMRTDEILRKPVPSVREIEETMQVLETRAGLR